MPLLYNDIIALNSNLHGDWKLSKKKIYPDIEKENLIPITVDEFLPASRHYPIIFSNTVKPVPIVLMGLNEGVNVYTDNGEIEKSNYVPAYIRRFPFILAKQHEDVSELSLCFEPNVGCLGEFTDGESLFENGLPSQVTKNALQFCEQYDLSNKRTTNFIEDLEQDGLLKEGVFTIRDSGHKEPIVYRGFKILDEMKFKDLDASRLMDLSKKNMLPLIYAHLSSLQNVREIFKRQMSALATDSPFQSS